MSKDDEDLRPKTLHELNMEQREINRKISEANKDDPIRSLPEPVRREIARKMQKPVRGPIKGN